MTDKLLIIEDDASISGELSRYYMQQSWKVTVAGSLDLARRYLLDEQFNPQVIIADLGLPDGNMVDHFQEINEHINHSEWLFVHERDDDTDRVNNLAYDVLEKPFDQKRLDIAVRRALRAANTTRRLQYYADAEDKRYSVDAYIGSSETLCELKHLLKQLSEVPISAVIIHGETGTGKGLTARILHHTGLRKNGPLVELNCAAVPRDLMESELFGHEAGAFTGARARHRGLMEQADGGTLFLDEIGDMDIDLQAKLLKAIEDKSVRRVGGERDIDVDVQIMAASATDLEKAVLQEHFRVDLYHRLSVFCIKLPPLRERKSDLAELVPAIVAECNGKSRRQVNVIPDTVWQKLLAYDWPGNIRELRNVIERSVLLSVDNVFPEKWLQLSEPDLSKNIPPIGDPGRSITLPLDGTMALADMDKYIIQTALERCDYNIAEATRILQTTRETLRYRIQKYQLDTTA